MAQRTRQGAQTCPVVMDTGEVCGRRVRTCGYCPMHYERSKRGKPMGARPARWRRPDLPCSFEGCNDLAIVHGLCSAHNHQRIKGTPLRPVERREYDWKKRLQYVLDGYRREDGCLVHPVGLKDGKRPTYSLTVDGKTRHVTMARAVYVAFVGPIPAGEQVHHTCGNGVCVEPSHLIPATANENVAEMNARTAFIKRIEDLEAEVERLRCLLDDCERGH